MEVWKYIELIFCNTLCPITQCSFARSSVSETCKQICKIIQILIIAQVEIIVIMIEENNDIFLPGGDALVYLAEPVHKKYSTAFVWDHPYSSYVSQDQFFNFQKKLCYLFQRKPFKSHEKRFSFQLKSSFRSQDI